MSPNSGRSQPSHLPEESWGGLCSSAAGQADWTGTDHAGAGPACWHGQWGWGAVRTRRGRAALAVDSAEGEGVRVGTGAAESHRKHWGCPRKLGSSALWNSRAGEGVPIRETHQPVDGVEGGGRPGPSCGKAEVQVGRGPGGDSGTTLGDEAGLRIKSKTLAAVS